VFSRKDLKMTEVMHAPADMNGPNAQKTEFRNYVNSEAQDRVAKFYHDNHVAQTFDFVMKKKEEFSKLNHKKMTIWEAVELLNEVVDDSDPDTSEAQIVHLLQTGEAIRAKYPGEEYDWFHLTGFIHDLGKILAHPKFAGDPQFCVVGDTFPVGLAYEKKVVFHDYFKENPDFTHPVYSTKFGIYKEHCGLDNVHFSWGHDEYLYQVMIGNKCTLPLEAQYIVRYHSFYAWHTGNAYKHITNEQDEKMLFWVKEFQKFDLYSKLPVKPDEKVLLPYYKGLIAKYFPAVCDW